ncbi:unnamed protein product [Rotaria socialis]
MESMSTLNNREKRVVSFFIWDPELERKIDREVKMIDGISKLLNVATTLEQTIECHKALILSQQRMLAFMAEIQRKQQNLLKSDDTNMEAAKSTVVLSDIRLPLIWTGMKAKSGQKRFAVFCLARIGCEIIDTTMKYIDKKSTEIVFTEKLIFNNVPHDFQLHLEVYALNKSLALSSSVKDFANRYSYFSTHGSQKMPKSNSNSSKSSVQPQSKFVLIARKIFNKGSADKMAKVYDLQMERLQENPLMRLPIRPSFISRFTIQPLCYLCSSTYAGILETNNTQYSCTLATGCLNGEEIVGDDASDQHRFSIPITSDTIISTRDNQHSFIIENLGFNREELFVHDVFTLRNWVRALQQQIVDMRAWEPTIEHLPSIMNHSHGSLNSLVKYSIIGTNLTKESMSPTKSRSVVQQKYFQFIHFHIEKIENFKLTDNLSSRDIKRKVAQHLADALAANTTITALNLKRSDISGRETQYLTNMLKTNKTLAILNLRGNSIEDHGAQRLGITLRRSTVLPGLLSILTTLFIFCNEIGDQGAEYIANALTTKMGNTLIRASVFFANIQLSQKTLTTLDLSSNKIEDHGAQCLGNALMINTTLIALRIDSNIKTDRGAHYFANALSHNTVTHDLIHIVGLNLQPL